MSKSALITGVTGQDGAYLSKQLHFKGYEVYGGIRRSSTPNTWRLEEIGVKDDIELVPLELLEPENIRRVIEEYEPDEIYNLAAQSFVGASFDQPLYTTKVNGLAVTAMLETIRNVDPSIKFYQASTSEMFGNTPGEIQSKETQFNPDSPYASSKLYAHSIVKNYRDAYDLYATSGICFNHESPFRGEEFVTRKITSSLARIKAGKQSVLELGNMDAKRDWGFAGDYTRGMHQMLQQETPDDYVLATGENHSVREFVEAAATELGYDIRWEGEGVDEVGIDQNTGETLVKVNPEFYRPVDVESLRGDPSNAEEELDWERTHDFDDLVGEMAKADLERANDKTPEDLYVAV